MCVSAEIGYHLLIVQQLPESVSIVRVSVETVPNMGELRVGRFVTYDKDRRFRIRRQIGRKPVIECIHDVPVGAGISRPVVVNVD